MHWMHFLGLILTSAAIGLWVQRVFNANRDVLFWGFIVVGLLFQIIGVAAR